MAEGAVGPGAAGPVPHGGTPPPWASALLPSASSAPKAGATLRVPGRQLGPWLAQKGDFSRAFRGTWSHAATPAGQPVGEDGFGHSGRKSTRLHLVIS